MVSGISLYYFLQPYVELQWSQSQKLTWEKNAFNCQLDLPRTRVCLCFFAKVDRVKTIKKLYHLPNYVSALTASLVDISQYSVQIDILSREKSVLSID